MQKTRIITATTMEHRIKTLQNNIQSIRPTEKREELEYFLKAESIEIACLQEIWLKEGENFRIKGFQMASRRRAEGYGGVGILVKDGIEYDEIQTRSFLPIEIVGIRISNLEVPLQIYSVYVPPDSSLARQVETKISELFEEFERISEEVLISGDFNAHHIMWDERRNTCNKGKTIAAALEHSKLSLMNDGSTTTIPRIDCNPSAIDLTFGTRKIVEKSNWEVVDQSFGSTHLGIIIETQLRMPIAELKTKKVNVTKAIEELNNIQPQYMYDVNEMMSIFNEA